jgi:tRNA dimethylallyltransferase
MRFIVAKLDMPRDNLYKKINTRVDDMMQAGLREEFTALIGKGYTRDSPGMQGVGYRELFDVEAGRYSLGAAMELIKRNSRRYAKRQITWFSHQVGGTTFDAGIEWTKLLSYYRENGRCG